MNIDIIFTKKEKISCAVIFLKDSTNKNIDATVAAAFKGSDREILFIPPSETSYFDPAYPSDGDNYVYRIEKGIYHISASPPFKIKKIQVNLIINLYFTEYLPNEITFLMWINEGE